MIDYHSLPIGDQAPSVIYAVVEIPKDSKHKYEYDPNLGVFRLDRVLHSAVYYPTEYGFVPSTNAGDGDPLDIPETDKFGTLSAFECMTSIVSDLHADRKYPKPGSFGSNGSSTRCRARPRWGLFLQRWKTELTTARCCQIAWRGILQLCQTSGRSWDISEPRLPFL
jgi:hypothetical protein